MKKRRLVKVKESPFVRIPYVPLYIHPFPKRTQQRVHMHRTDFQHCKRCLTSNPFTKKKEEKSMCASAQNNTFWMDFDQTRPELALKCSIYIIAKIIRYLH